MIIARRCRFNKKQTGVQPRGTGASLNSIHNLCNERLSYGPSRAVQGPSNGPGVHPCLSGGGVELRDSEPISCGRSGIICFTITPLVPYSAPLQLSDSAGEFRVARHGRYARILC